MIAFLFIVILCVFNAQAQVKLYASLPSPAMPMSVKTPYLNTWLPYANGTGPGRLIPQTWANKSVGHGGLIRVDGKTYQWMGSSTGFPSAKTLNQYLSPTRTVLVMMAGPVQMNVTWFSPIEPDDWVKLSFPFTYFYIDIATADGNAHDVQLYTDITGEWVNANPRSAITWNMTEGDEAIYHEMKLQKQQLMVETDEMAGDVTIYLAAQKKFNVSWQTGADLDIARDSFVNGNLGNTMNTAYRSIDAGYPVLSFSYDLSTITSTSSIVWALGAVRDPTISYRAGNKAQLRSAPYWSKTNSIGDSINEFLNDFPNAVSRADVLDNKIMNDGLEVSSEYADLLALCLRQVMASIEITISKDDGGDWNERDVKSFMKDTGASPRVTPVDHLYASFPALLYINASLAGTLLNPLLELQAELGADIAAGAIGMTYPIAWGDTVADPAQAITNNGDMLFMLAAHAKKSGDTLLISQHYDMLKRWADFLVSVSLYPGAQYETANEVNYPNMTNLALQGIVGIHAMSTIAEILQKTDDVEIYSRNTSTLLFQWQNLAFAEDHFVTGYQNSHSWSVMYNLYSAKMIGLEVDRKILDAQTKFYELQSQVAPRFGFSYTAETSLVRSYWLLLTSATTTSTTARDIFIKQVHDRFFWNGTSDFPSPSTYDKKSGASNGFPGGRSGQTLGAAFAHLALNVPDKVRTTSTNSTTTNIPPSQITSSSSQGKKKNTGVIVGSVVGALLSLLAIFGGIILIYMRRRKPRKIHFRQSMLLRDAPGGSMLQASNNNDIIYNPMLMQPPILPSNEKSRRKAKTTAAPLMSPITSESAQTSNVQSSSWGGATSTNTSILRNQVKLLREELNAIRAYAAVKKGSPPGYYPDVNEGLK